MIFIGYLEFRCPSRKVIFYTFAHNIAHFCSRCGRGGANVWRYNDIFELKKFMGVI